MEGILVSILHRNRTNKIIYLPISLEKSTEMRERGNVKEERHIILFILETFILRNWLMSLWASLKSARQSGMLNTQGRVDVAVLNLKAEFVPLWRMTLFS